MSHENNFRIVIFQKDKELINFKINEENLGIWATLKEIATLYDVDETTVSRHIVNIFSDDELNQSTTTAYFAVVQNEGKRKVNKILTHYNLDIIISVGYRVNVKKR